MIFDLKSQKVYLYKDAFITYKDIELKADYVEIDFAKNEAYACGVTDSLGNVTGKPAFKDGGEEFEAETIRYNFKSKKGIITGVVSEQSGGYLHSQRTKKLANNEICMKNGMYTTCNLDHPHFHITLTKAKVIPDEKIVSGPAYLVIEDVPLPLGIPFGYFPNKKGNTSGVIIPEYGEEQNRGFFLKNGGYYFAISDKMDISLVGEVYSKGSWGMTTVSNYKKRYKYAGNLKLTYSKLIFGERGLSNYQNQDSYWLWWNHSQDTKAHPNHSFSANLNLGSSSYNKYNSYTSSNRLRNQVSSSVAFNQNWPGTPFSMSANLRHDQNFSDSTMSVTFPEITANMSRLYLFKRKNATGPQRWYESFGASASVATSNSLSGKEDEIFTEESLRRFRNGMRFGVPVSASFKIFRYFTLNPSLSITERLYLLSVEKYWDHTDSTLRVDTIKGVRHAGDFIVSIPFTTKLYGMYQSKNPEAKIVAVRHVLTPSVSLNLRPDFSRPLWGYYKTVQKDTLGNMETYSIFNGGSNAWSGIYGSPPAGKFGQLQFSLGNNVEMKTRHKKDTSIVINKTALLESFNINSSYNMALDSIKWGPVVIQGRTTLFKYLSINFSAYGNIYDVDSLGRTVDEFLWSAEKTLGRITNANISLGINLNSDLFKSSAQPIQNPAETEPAKMAALAAGLPPNYLEDYVDFKIPWSLRADYQINYAATVWDATLREFTPVVTKTLNFSGDFNLTEKWKISFNSGYDFTQKDISYTSVNIIRDLHCWEMRLSWIPFGFYKSYNFQINVKASVLQDLKINKRRAWTDNF
jgi:hypothetical protein